MEKNKINTEFKQLNEVHISELVLALKNKKDLYTNILG